MEHITQDSGDTLLAKTLQRLHENGHLGNIAELAETVGYDRSLIYKWMAGANPYFQSIANLFAAVESIEAKQALIRAFARGRQVMSIVVPDPEEVGIDHISPEHVLDAALDNAERQLKFARVVRNAIADGKIDPDEYLELIEKIERTGQNLALTRVMVQDCFEKSEANKKRRHKLGGAV